MYETDFGRRTWEVERDDVVEYLRSLARKFIEVDKPEQAAALIQATVDIEAGEHVLDLRKFVAPGVVCIQCGKRQTHRVCDSCFHGSRPGYSPKSDADRFGGD